MDKESIQKKLYDELDRLGKELNLPEAEINRMKLQYVDIAELTEDPDMLTRLSDDLISSLLYRANQGIPDNVPDELIVENIPNQPNLDKVESDELEKIFGDEKLNPDYDPVLGRKGVMGVDYIPNYAEDFAEFTDGRITSLPDNHIFVFGSNEAGRHGKGAALKTDYVGENINWGTIFYGNEEEHLQVGGYTSLVASEALLLYGEGAFVYGNNALYPVTSDNPLGYELTSLYEKENRKGR